MQITIDRRINNLKWAEGLNGTVNDKVIRAKQYVAGKIVHSNSVPSLVRTCTASQPCSTSLQ
jgi:hypothetical protein